MPSDARKLSYEELIGCAELCYGQLDPNRTTVSEFPKASHCEALTELRRCLKIMRELCEAASAIDWAQAVLPKVPQQSAFQRFAKALEACEEMEAERERP